MPAVTSPEVTLTDTEIRPDQPWKKLPLGVGEIIGDSFHILLSNFFLVILVGFIPALLGELVNGALNGFGSLSGQSETTFIGVKFEFESISEGIVTLVAFAISTALLVQLAYDARLYRPVKISRYLETAMRSILPIAVLSVAISAVLFAGGLLIVLPAAQIGFSPIYTLPVIAVLALWICAVFSAMAPSIVIERIGFRGFTRSIALTKGFRWPIVGALVLSIIITGIISVLATLLMGFIIAVGGTLGFILGTAVMVGISTLVTGLFSILVTLIYARLREIKDGLGLKEIAAVFE